MDLSTRKLLLAACKPDEPLENGDRRYEPIDEVKDGAGPRGISCTDAIADQIELKPVPEECYFFSGLPGSGKSTELRRLAYRLGKADGANLYPVLIDAEELIDVDSPIDLPDLLLVLVFGAERGVLKMEGAPASKAFQEGPVRRFLHWFTTTEVELKELELSAEGKGGLPGVAELTAGAKLALELKNQPSLRESFRKRTATQFNQFLAEVRDELHKLAIRAKAARVDGQWFDGLVLLVDSLEKLRGTSKIWADVLDSAEVVFKRLDAGLSLPVHTVFTVPPALVLRLNIPNLQFMPMIKLWDRRTRTSDSNGFAVATRMIQRRIPDPQLREILGEQHFEARRRRIIDWCAGYPRELVRILGTLVAHRTTSAQFDQILSQAANNLLDVVTTEEAAQVVAQVSLDTDIHVPDNLRPVLDQLMSDNVILRYQNHERWYDVHPAIRETPAVQREMARIRALRERKAQEEGPVGG